MKTTAKNLRSLSADLVVIGRGLAGSAAAAKARERGWSVHMISLGPGATSLCAGPWDFGVRAKTDESLTHALHSLSWAHTRQRLLKEEFDYCESSLRQRIKNASAHLNYEFEWDRPFLLLTGHGSIRSAYGSQKVQTRVSCGKLSGREVTVLDIEGLRVGTESLVALWRDAVARLGLPIRFVVEKIVLADSAYDFSAEHIFTRLRSNTSRIEILLEHLRRLKDREAILIPPILPEPEVLNQLGGTAPIGEWVPSQETVAGMRLQNDLSAWMEASGVISHRASESVAGPNEARMESIVCRIDGDWTRFSAPRFVMATGRLLSGGIEVGYHQVRETLAALPLFTERSLRIQLRDEIQRSSRGEVRFDGWARLGAWADKNYCPLDDHGRNPLENVRVAGSIIGGVDLARTSMGLGFSDYTGAECVESFE